MRDNEVMQDSGVEWIGAIPKDWCVKSIKRFATVKRGASPRPIDDSKYFDDNGEFAWVRIADVSASGRYLEKTTQRLSKLGESLSVKQYPNDLIISIAGTVGKPIISKIKCCIHDGFIWFENPKFNKDYLFYIFLSEQPYGGLGKLGTQLNLNTETIGKIFMPVPKLIEQQAIAQYLDQQCAKLDAIITIKQQQIKTLDALRQSVIYQAVTKGLDASAQLVDSGVEWLGDIPDNWKVQQIKRRCELLRGKFSHRPRNDPAFYNGDYPFVQTGDVTSANKYIKTYTQTLNELGLSVSKMFPRKTLVMTIAANVGDVAILNFDACFPDSLVGLVPYHDTHLDFVYYLMLAMKKVVLSSAILTTQLNLNNVQIGTNFAPFPPLSEQRAIADHLDQETQRLNTLKANLNHQISTLEAYKKSLIYECVTGKKRVKS